MFLNAKDKEIKKITNNKEISTRALSTAKEKEKIKLNDFIPKGVIRQLPKCSSSQQQ